MPIRINLMAEAQAAEEARRRDPVKMGAWIAALCVAAVGAWSMSVQFDVSFANSGLRKLADDWKHDETNFNTVEAQKTQLKAAQDKIAALDHLQTNRFLWGPVLNALQFTTVNEIQLTHFNGAQAFEKEANRIIAGKTVIGTAYFEKVKLTLAGKDYSQGGEGYKIYEDALNHYPYFVKMGGHDGFTIDGVPGPKRAEVGSTTESRAFTLTNQFLDIKRNQ